MKSDENKISHRDKIEIKVTVKNGKPKTNYDLRYDPAEAEKRRCRETFIALDTQNTLLSTIKISF